MATRNILNGSEDILRKKSREVAVFDKRLHQLLEDMAETMAEANGLGLAAPQVGVLRRVFIAQNGDKNVEFINPNIVWRSDETVTEHEGCLSFPGEYGYVERPQSVTVQAQDRRGNFFEMTGEGILARAICHEIDHLDGVLFVDLTEEVLSFEEDDE
ncbi:MAG: peptide deformylase [Oscillospiraceae bacterium]|nr:peptide deformylase [Oscillospiraceae bacterium]